LRRGGDDAARPWEDIFMRLSDITHDSVFGLRNEPTMQQSAATSKGSAANKGVNKLLNEKLLQELRARTTCQLWPAATSQAFDRLQAGNRNERPLLCRAAILAASLEVLQSFSFKSLLTTLYCGAAFEVCSRTAAWFGSLEAKTES